MSFLKINVFPYDQKEYCALHLQTGSHADVAVFKIDAFIELLINLMINLSA